MIDIVHYLAEFGLSLAELRPKQLAMFVAARNLGPAIDAIRVPLAPPHGEPPGSALRERLTERVVEQRGERERFLGGQLPSDEMEIAPIRSTEDLARILPSQWLLETTVPELFYAKLAGRELFVPEWQTPDPHPSDARGETRDRELAESHAAPRSVRQHAYVLLDTSRTMNDRDARGTVARGLALAFLRQGHDDRARLNVRPFAAEVGELSCGWGLAEFRAIARRIVELPNAGQTRIQAALEQAVRDIRQCGPCHRADILLITDGLSRIVQNPLGCEKLHTVLLGDFAEKQGQAGTIRTLRNWSSTFRRMSTSHFAEILAPTLDDLQAAGEQLQRARGEGPASQLRPLRENMAFLLREFRRRGGQAAELQSLEELVDPAESAADSAARPGRIGLRLRGSPLERRFVMPWTVRYALLLVGHIGLGAAFLSGGWPFTWREPRGAALGGLLVAANAAAFGLLAGAGRLRAISQTLFLTGIVVSTAVAFAGARLPAGHDGHLLTLAATLANMELLVFAAWKIRACPAPAVARERETRKPDAWTAGALKPHAADSELRISA